MLGKLNAVSEQLAGKTIVIEAKANETVEDLKGKIEERDGISSDSLKLDFQGMGLTDKRMTLSCCGIGHDQTVHVSLRLSGC
ncbi:hypothetical protein PRIPAC_73896 [Pristionchus pacificus]|uniref:Ubiquitin n=1 Tax=Pristionchus pacificus TaxID=54126 RepID=A0A2A6BGE5_PRIPA|nr:hypothetical protein PRIPAC_73896 [Pristionchus pacificus]|eukprot:PDM64952.1 Ubiquitin [Pristionchus pacificus]